MQELTNVKGKKAFIVADGIMKELGYLQKTIDYLSQANIESDVFSEVRPDPSIDIVTEGLSLYKRSNADIIVALGGGSAIDTAKGIVYFAERVEKLNEANFKKPQFIAIPSTSGTGSEATDFTVITSEGEKICFIDESLAPDLAILDSTCIQHVPQHVCADTGIDVLVHSIEAYVSKNASDFTDALAEKAIKLIFDFLEPLYNDTKNDYARDRILNASCMAGMAFTNTGLGINHSLAHALGATFHLSHGRSNALLLEGVMEYNADLSGKANDYATEKYAKLAKMLQLPARTKREGAVNFISAVSKLKKNLKIENSISSFDIKKEDFEQALEQMSTSALNDRCTPTNPKNPTKDELVGILKRCYKGKRTY
ncbi:1-propanol dehydrogenase PduQ [Proteinivorax tanatarense]|uniref:1-propanol dehydrogenase PduQ n=1 Tax=Proteinivorax tanatarense TaxID=1260629 RepID=A0AAU7VMG7_9FIRM